MLGGIESSLRFCFDIFERLFDMKPSARLKWVLLFGCLLVWQVVVAHDQRLDELARNLIDNNASDEVALRAYKDWVSAQSEDPPRFSALPEGQSRFSALVDHIRKKTIPQRKLPAGSRQSGRLHLDPKKFRLMHLHMYKTGGSSVNQLFNAMCQTIPTRPCLEINSFHPNATLELNRFSLAEWSTDVTEAWRRKWARASWVWGHWWWPWTPALVELMSMDPARDRVVTVLRDPILSATPIDGWLLSYTDSPPLPTSPRPMTSTYSSDGSSTTLAGPSPPQQAAQFTSLRANSASPIHDVSLENLS